MLVYTGDVEGKGFPVKSEVSGWKQLAEKLVPLQKKQKMKNSGRKIISFSKAQIYHPVHFQVTQFFFIKK